MPYTHSLALIGIFEIACYVFGFAPAIPVMGHIIFNNQGYFGVQSSSGLYYSFTRGMAKKWPKREPKHSRR
jgi:hypothetical protein